MATQVQRRRGSTAQHSSFTGAAGEVTVDTDKNVVVTHDGVTAGGYPHALQSNVDLKADKANLTFTGTINGGPLSGSRNKITNGDGAHNQRSASSGISDDELAHDRHYALTQSNSITVSTLDNPEDGISHMMRLTQDNASAQRMGYAQILEAEESYPLRGKGVTLGGKLRYSNAAAIRYAVLEWTGTADSVTSDVVNDWTSGTYTSGNFFNSTTLTVTQVGSITPSAATITDWSMTATVGSSANNVIVFFWTEGTAAQSSTLDMRWYLVEGDATNEDDPFSPRMFSQELALCERFYQVAGAGSSGAWSSATTAQLAIKLPTVMRTTPTLGVTSGTITIANTGIALRTSNGSSTASVVGTFTNKGGIVAINDFTAAASAGDPAACYENKITFDAEL
jgi:hypothetical protein